MRAKKRSAAEKRRFSPKNCISIGYAKVGFLCARNPDFGLSGVAAADEKSQGNRKPHRFSGDKRWGHGSANHLTLTVTVTDSRGRTASATRTVTVLDYSPPSLSQFTAERCSADGTAAQTDGTKVRISAKAYLQHLPAEGLRYRGLQRRFGDRITSSVASPHSAYCPSPLRRSRLKCAA